MPREVFGEDFVFLRRDELLSFEEIARLARIFAEKCGVRKIRLTGGEPLLRRNIEQLVAMLAKIDSIEDIALTTNGSLLTKKARALRNAGLHRLTVSVDSLDDAIFSAMNDAAFPVARVLEGIDAALAAGFSPIKINTVVRRGVNDDGILEMARRFRSPQFILRLIEYMDVGNTNKWRATEVVPAAEIIEKISAAMPLEPLPPNYLGEVAKRFRHRESQENLGGEIGVISSVTQPFCGACSRARLSSDGQLYTCLFASRGFDLRRLLRDGSSDAQIFAAIAKIWMSRTDRYSELRSVAQRVSERKVEMSRIGG